MAKYEILLKTDEFVLVKHTPESKYSFGTITDFELWKSNKGYEFPVSEFYITAEEMIDRMEAWKKIDKKYADINETYVTEQSVIDVLIRIGVPA